MFSFQKDKKRELEYTGMSKWYLRGPNSEGDNEDQGHIQGKVLINYLDCLY
jgi:hypothetical protein